MFVGKSPLVRGERGDRGSVRATAGRGDDGVVAGGVVAVGELASSSVGGINIKVIGDQGQRAYLTKSALQQHSSPGLLLRDWQVHE